MSILLAIACFAIDGDTIRCGKERIRLAGIDAPEMPGHCRRGRRCTPGDPMGSKASLSTAMREKPLRIERFGRDRSGRTIAIVYAGRVNLSCHQLESRNAAYRYDQGGRIAMLCEW